MKTEAVKGTWNIVKGKFKQKFAQLTDDDFQFTQGKEDELVGRILKRSGEPLNSRRHSAEGCCGGCHH